MPQPHDDRRPGQGPRKPPHGWPCEVYDRGHATEYTTVPTMICWVVMAPGSRSRGWFGRAIIPELRGA